MGINITFQLSRIANTFSVNPPEPTQGIPRIRLSFHQPPSYKHHMGTLQNHHSETCSHNTTWPLSYQHSTPKTFASIPFFHFLNFSINNSSDSAIRNEIICIKQILLLLLLLYYYYYYYYYDYYYYDFSETWISQQLDNLCTNRIREWTEMPISGCVKEITSLPKKLTGLGIPSLLSTHQKLWLGKRSTLKTAITPHTANLERFKRKTLQGRLVTE